MPDNEALWLAAKGGPFEVRPAPYPAPAPDEIVVRARAVAVNPVDWLLPIIGGMAFPWMTYPCVVGSDVAGEVVEVGATVTRLKAGDRVLGHAAGLDPKRPAPAERAFQLFPVLLERMTTPIPDALGFEQACVVPLGCSTAACGLFEQDFLALRPPRLETQSSGEVVLVWGASTSVGMNAVQLATAAGYGVIAAASPKHAEALRALGAEQVIDRTRASAVADILRAVGARRLAGALAIGGGSPGPCLEVVGACDGAKVVAMASTPVTFDDAPDGNRLLWLAGKLPRFLLANLSLQRRAKRLGVRTPFIFGGSLANNEVGPLIYADFLPGALAQGRFRAVPEAEVVGDGLRALPAAMQAQRRGVSARKIVVRL